MICYMSRGLSYLVQHVSLAARDKRQIRIFRRNEKFFQKGCTHVPRVFRTRCVAGRMRLKILHMGKITRTWGACRAVCRVSAKINFFLFFVKIFFRRVVTFFVFTFTMVHYWSIMCARISAIQWYIIHVSTTILDG